MQNIKYIKKLQKSLKAYSIKIVFIDKIKLPGVRAFLKVKNMQALSSKRLKSSCFLVSSRQKHEINFYNHLIPFYLRNIIAYNIQISDFLEISKIAKVSREVYLPAEIQEAVLIRAWKFSYFYRKMLRSKTYWKKILHVLSKTCFLANSWQESQPMSMS